MEKMINTAEVVDRVNFDPGMTMSDSIETLLKSVVTYAQGRLNDGFGINVLQTLDADVPEFVQAYGLGYLPHEFRSILAEEARKSFSWSRITRAIVVPAFDQSGAIVDLFSVHANNKGNPYVNLSKNPQGLLAPVIVTAFDNIIVTDSFANAARCFRAGQRNVLFIRGIKDVKNNAQWMHSCGVRTVTVDAKSNPDEIISLLVQVGIDAIKDVISVGVDASTESNNSMDVEDNDSSSKDQIKSPAEKGDSDSAPLSAAPVSCTDANPAEAIFPIQLTLEHCDEKAHRAVFRAGEALYRVEIGTSGSRIQLSLERNGKIHGDRFDLSVEAQRKRFASSAAMRTNVPRQVIEEHLLRLLGDSDLVQAEPSPSQFEESPCAVELLNAEKRRALDMLERDDLLDVIANDLEDLGLVGEDKIKRLLYLAAISRKLSTPLSIVCVSSPGVEKSLGLETMALLTPPEDLLHVSRLTRAALYYQEKDALKHKLLIVDEAALMTPEVKMALHILQTRGALSQSHVLRNPSTGTGATRISQAQGPVAVLTSTIDNLDSESISGCFYVAVDESSAQTQRVLEKQRRLRADPEYLGDDGLRASIVRKHHALQRLLKCKPVTIPFAPRIQFPASSVRYRKQQECFLNLIEAIALLNQHKRSRQRNNSGQEFIVAEIQDYETAVKLASDLIGQVNEELSSHARDIFALIIDSGLTTFTLDDLKILHPDWTRYRYRTALNELLKIEVIVSPVGGRGKVRKYNLCPTAIATLAAPAVRLLTAQEVRDLAKVGEGEFSNLIPDTAAG